MLPKDKGTPFIRTKDMQVTTVSRMVGRVPTVHGCWLRTLNTAVMLKMISLSPTTPRLLSKKSKFIPRIATAPFPMNVKIPSKLQKYNGMTDPSDHLLNFTAVGGASGWTLPYLCHMFALTLTGAARKWFEKLPDGHTKSWDDLVAKFSQHFSQQRKHTCDPSEILNVVPHNNESVENFITRFNYKSLNIGGISEDILRGAFRQNVRSDDLIRCLTGRDGMPKTWDGIMSSTRVFAATEKLLGREKPKPQAKTEVKNAHPQKEERGSIWSRIQQPEGSSKQFDARSLIGQKQKDHKSGKHEQQHWTPLRKTPAEILTTENIESRKPQQLTRRLNLNPNKHCMFHDDIGHDTNDCLSQRNEIESAIKSGKT
ncbi:uncharacterized protein LOC143607288 [Bidens hawaiensis]|uniref:uncharacterized protein LOC143607288 n=1 Tax=Bidens hawaiensis TaxID=980011 RepID=UPI0040493E43